MIIYHFENPKAIQNYAKSTLPLLYKRDKKACITVHLHTIWFTEYFNHSAQKKGFLPKYDNVSGYARALVKIYNMISVVFMAANTHPFSAHDDQEVISTFKSLFKKCIL